MPTWPSGTKAGTTNVDNPNDLVANARADIKQNIDNVNDVIDTFNISSPNDGDLLQYSSSSGQWEQVASSSVGSAADFAILGIASTSDDDNELVETSVYRRPLLKEFDPNNFITLDDSAGLSTTFTLGAGDYIFEVHAKADDTEGILTIRNETDDTAIGTLAQYEEFGTSGSGLYHGDKGFTLTSTKSLSITVTAGSPANRTADFHIRVTKF